MKYNQMNKSEANVSRFGLGCMRFPNTEGTGDEKKIDQELVNKMVHSAWENGVNYFDTAYLYKGSEAALGTALQGIPRDSIFIASKLPMATITKDSDLEQLLDESLKDLKTQYIDYYLLHAMQEKRWELAKEMDMLAFMEKMREKGKIRKIGFSFHANLSLFKEMIDAYDWDMCQIQLNILDTTHQAGLEGLRYASSKDIPVVIMEPLRGGALVNHVPEKVKNLTSRHTPDKPSYVWAMKWLYDMPEVKVVLSGVSNLEQLNDHINIVQESAPDSLTPEDHAMISQMQDEYRAAQNIGCTHCSYCMPCPQGVDIPEIFDFYNGLTMPSYEYHCKFQYTRFINGAGKGVDNCTACGACESLCPQQLNITEALQDAHSQLLL